MKGKSGKSYGSFRSKLGLPALLFVFCLFCFLIGFFGSSLLSQDVDGDSRRSRLLQSVSDGGEFDLMRSGESGDESISSIPFQVLSWRPRALFFPKFATAEQCQSIVNMAKPKLRPSTLALRKGETEENTKGIRTSSGVFFSASEDASGTLGVIEEKIARATMLPRMHGENFDRDSGSVMVNSFNSLEKMKPLASYCDDAFNILRYEIGQKYNSHYDAFNPSEYGPQKSQRVASFLLYLTDVEEGGETMFPFENGSNMDGTYDYQGCTGLKVKPRQGDGLLFYSVFPNGTIDPTSLHGSCSVIKGQKWVATKWIRDQVQDD